MLFYCGYTFHFRNVVKKNKLNSNSCLGHLELKKYGIPIISVTHTQRLNRYSSSELTRREGAALRSRKKWVLSDLWVHTREMRKKKHLLSFSFKTTTTTRHFLSFIFTRMVTHITSPYTCWIQPTRIVTKMHKNRWI